MRAVDQSVTLATDAGMDAPGELSDSSEPLVLYSVEGAENDIRVSKDGAMDTVRLTF